jgi:hypothetical protein
LGIPSTVLGIIFINSFLFVIEETKTIWNLNRW